MSPEAQFTPKQVETRSERDKLMFRVKIQVPEELVTHYIERIKTGVRGVGYVKVDESAVWPAWLQNLVAPQRIRRKGEPRTGEASRISNERQRSEAQIEDSPIATSRSRQVGSKNTHDDGANARTTRRTLNAQRSTPEI